MFEELIGKSVKSVEEVDGDIEIVFTDGTKIMTEVGNPDCCGYNGIDVLVSEDFDFSDNFVTRVEYNEDERYGDGETVSLGIFSNNASINLEGSYGSGSGYYYGQFVSIELYNPKMNLEVE